MARDPGTYDAMADDVVEVTAALPQDTVGKQQLDESATR